MLDIKFVRDNQEAVAQAMKNRNAAWDAEAFAQLDERRRAAMCRFVQNGIQTVITTTNLGYFPQELLDDAKVVEIDG